MYRILFRNELDDEFGYACGFEPMPEYPPMDIRQAKSVLRHLHKVSPVWMSYIIEEVTNE